MNLISVVSKDSRLPYSRLTLYKLHSQGRLPGILVKVGGKLFFDLDRWEALVEKVQADAVRRAERWK